MYNYWLWLLLIPPVSFLAWLVSRAIRFDRDIERGRRKIIQDIRSRGFFRHYNWSDGKVVCVFYPKTEEEKNQIFMTQEQFENENPQFKESEEQS